MVAANTRHDGDDGMSFSLNLDHPEFQKAIRLGLHLKESFPGSVAMRVMDRVNRRSWFDRAMERIGNLPAFRRKLVVRELVRMYAKGRVNAFVLAAVSEGVRELENGS